MLSGEARAGTVVGPYRIDALVGAGGMGAVYRAVHLESGTTCALKVLRGDAIESAERRRRFVREAKLVTALDHPSIVKTIEAGDVEGDAFLAMELVEGRSLKKWMADERPSLARGIAVMRAIVDAVTYAHGKGVVHRDLKPDNVMVTDGDAVRVLDFGLAKLRESEGGALYEAETETSLTHEGRVMGTPGYMPPEQSSGREVGFPADVFALGAILYELATGTRAFAGDSPIDLIVSVSRDRPALPSTRNPACNAELDALVMRCLEKDPAARPTSEQLAAALADPSLVARARSRTPFLVGGVVVAMALGAFAIASKNPIAGAAGPVATAVTDLPIPASTVPRAVEIYKKALADERDGFEDASQEELEEATKLDPTLAAAHLKLALRTAPFSSTAAYSHFSQATKFRERLTPRDREVLEAARPLFQNDPPDAKGFRARLEVVSQHYPGDADLLLELQSANDTTGDFAAAEATAQRAVQVDPKFGLAWAAIATVQAYRGKFDESLATVKHCLEVTPASTYCIWIGEFLDDAAGRCAAHEGSARRRLAIDPNVPNAYKSLTYALMSEEKPDALVHEAIEQTARRMVDDYDKRLFDRMMSARLEVRHGDFAKANEIVKELRAVIATRSDAPDHANAALLSAQIASEMGEPDRAEALAKEFLDRQAAWQVYPIIHDYTMASDLTPALARFVRGSEPAVDEWRKRYDQGSFGDYRPYLWVYGWAQAVVTPEDAKKAVAALSAYGKIPPFLPNGAAPELSIGRTLWLAGREDEGIEALRKAASGCTMSTRPVEAVHAHALLAEALQKKGDVAGACAATGYVLAHWGNAKPRSITAEAAKARSQALGCETR